MKWVSIFVEGQTEESFVLDVLYPYLIPKEICVVPIISMSSETPAGVHFKGGIGPFDKVERQIKRLLLDTHSSLVTTMIDFYGLNGKGFPGWDNRPIGTPYRQVTHVEAAFSQRIDHRRFLPYLALHEFEALLFVDPAAILREFPGNPPEQLQQLVAVKEAFASPEEINHEHPPSKRILEIVPNYDKTFGSLIAVTIGLNDIRAACPHFDGWLKEIEKLAEA